MADKLLDDLKQALGDAYHIERELSGGGMSRVFVARERALGREVVIKVLPPELARGMNHERFRREVQLAARLSHPYIVPLLNAGESGDLLWFTMPFIPGESLKQQLEARGKLPVDEVVRMLRDVAEALTYAHSHGVIHRDIKPGNILSDGMHAQVTDFGVAKALGAALPGQGVAGHTTSGMAIGTPAYMAPEQLAADPAADHRVDIYAMGLLGYELLSGKSPFEAESPTATMAAQLTRVPAQLDGMPAALSSLIAECLSKDPANRPADAKSVLASLDKISGALAADIHRGTSGESPEGSFAPASQWPLALSALAVIGLIVSGLVWSQRGEAPAPVAAVPDTVFLPAPGGDTSELARLQAPDAPMTRSDSLAIAEALRDEWLRVNGTRGELGPQSDGTLELRLRQADSLVRSRLIAIGRSLDTLSASRSGSPSVGEPSRVMISAARNRSEDPRIDELSQAVVRSLSSRLERVPIFKIVDPPDSNVVMESELPAEIIVTVGARTRGDDSASVQISIRNAMPGSSHGFHVISGEPFPIDSPSFRSIVRDATALLADLRNTRGNAPWRFDVGRSQPPTQ